MDGEKCYTIKKPSVSAEGLQTEVDEHLEWIKERFDWLSHSNHLKANEVLHHSKCKSMKDLTKFFTAFAMVIFSLGFLLIAIAVLKAI